MKRHRLVRPSKRHGYVDSSHPCITERPIWFTVGLLTSEAYRSLRSPTSYIVYGIFKTKCQMENVGTKREPRWQIANDGKIEFSYKEAKDKYGISEQRFLRAIDDLVDKGFIDIRIQGGSEKGDMSLYAISNRWRYYGTDSFEKQERVKRVDGPGFAKGNKHGRNCNPDEKSQYVENVQQQKRFRRVQQSSDFIDELTGVDRRIEDIDCEIGRLSSTLDASNDTDKSGVEETLRKLSRERSILNELRKQTVDRLARVGEN